MAKDMTLWWGAGSPPCWRVMIALEEKGLQGNCNCKEMSFEKGEHKSPEVMKINPRGQLPAFQHGKIIINDSAAVCIYLEDIFKKQGTSLTPEAPEEKAMMWQRIWEVNEIMKAVVDYAYYDYKVPEGERHESARKRNKEALSAELKRWEGFRTECNAEYLAGKSFSLADVVVFPVIAYLFSHGLCEKKYPKLAVYYNHLKTRPSIKKVLPKETTDKLKDI